MSTYTTVGKTIICPCLKIKVTLKGKYYFAENESNPYEARFHYATCPIVENSRPKTYEQNDEYKYLRCPNPDEHCGHMFDFPEIIDVRKTTCIK